uniref:Uncharacterized protein n=1 Tax=Theropithecus gelada TaxID=9565 RepID=A0A8D2FGR9_THEGE
MRTMTLNNTTSHRFPNPQPGHISKETESWVQGFKASNFCSPSLVSTPLTQGQ